MALIKIKQINNTPAVAGDVITFNGTNNVWAPVSDPITIEEFDISIVSPASTINFEGNVDVVDDGAGKATVIVGQANALGRPIQHLFVGGSEDSWMFLGDSNSTPPSGPESSVFVSPAVFGADVETFILTFSNKNDGVDVDAQFYINGTLAFTWEIRNAHVATRTSGLGSLIINAGDRLGIFLLGAGPGTVDQATIDVICNITAIPLIDTTTPTIP